MLPGQVAWISVQARQGVPNRSFRVNCSTIISTIATVARLYIYPVKSMAGVQVEEVHVGVNGVLGDRRFVSTENRPPKTDNRLVTRNSRTYFKPSSPSYCRITP